MKIWLPEGRWMSRYRRRVSTRWVHTLVDHRTRITSIIQIVETAIEVSSLIQFSIERRTESITLNTKAWRRWLRTLSWTLLWRDRRVHFLTALLLTLKTHPPTIGIWTELAWTNGFLNSSVIRFTIRQVTTPDAFPTQPTATAFAIVFVLLIHFTKISIALTTHFTATMMEHIKFLRQVTQITSSPRNPRPYLFY